MMSWKRKMMEVVYPLDTRLWTVGAIYQLDIRLCLEKGSFAPGFARC